MRRGSDRGGMKHYRTSATRVWLGMTMVVMLICSGERSVTAQETEVLRVTVGAPTFLSPLVYQNRASVTVSRTGVVAAFYPKPGTGPKYYRTSTDGGGTWGKEMEFPPQSVTPMSVGLKDGGVLFMSGCAVPVKGGKPGELEASRIVFSDDFKTYEGGTSAVFIPDAALNIRWAEFWPPFDKGKIVQLPNGDLMAPMYGNFKGDAQYRTMIVRSTDLGKSWNYHATVAYYPNDPDPGLVGGYCGYCEPSIALLPDGRFLCAMRTQGAQFNGEYRPLYVSWSDAQGKNWTKPVPTIPHLMNIWPTLAVLDNGVVACQHGRPGVHLAFSVDGGRTWRDRVSFSDLHEPVITGQGDIVKVGPNRLVAIGNDAEGIKVWTIDVERVQVSQAHTTLTGRVLNAEGAPVVGAKAQLGPNRYAADSWTESEDLDPWGATHNPVHPPELGYRSIAEGDRYPVVKTDARGQFTFENVKLAEYVLTVEADDYAPQWRHINVAADPKGRTQQFQLKSGSSVRGRAVDHTGKPVGGVCVVLDKLHIHADSNGFFHWAIDAPVPDEVNVKVYKRYNGDYTTFEEKVSPSRIEGEPIVVRRQEK